MLNGQIIESILQKTERYLNRLRVKSNATHIIFVNKAGKLIYSLEHPLNGMTLEKMNNLVADLTNGQSDAKKVSLLFKEKSIEINESSIELPMINSSKKAPAKAFMINISAGVIIMISQGQGIDLEKKKQIIFETIDLI